MVNDLEIRHCRVLVAVSEHGGVGSAARALGLAQSTVSEALSSLERTIGAPVVMRQRGRQSVLTSVAQALLPHARALISASEAALAAVSAGSVAVIRMGSVESASTFLLPPLLTAFRSRWPDIEVHVCVGLCNELIERVRRGDLDAALTLESGAGAQGEHHGRRQRLCPAKLCLVVSPREPSGSLTVGRADLARRTLLLPDPDGAFTLLLRAWFGPGHRLRFESAGSIDGVKESVRDGEFVGVLPTYAVADDLASGSLQELQVRERLPGLALWLTLQREPLDVSPLSDMVKLIEKGVRGAAVSAASAASRAPRRN